MTNDFSLKLIRRKKEVVGLKVEAKIKNEKNLVFFGDLYYRLYTGKAEIILKNKKTFIISCPTGTLVFKETKKVFNEIKKIIKNKKCTAKALYCGLEIIKN